MAMVNAALGSYADDTCRVTVRYNDANGSVASVTVANNSPLPFWYRAWLLSDPTQQVTGSVPAGTSQTFNVPGGMRYSPVELPPGDPATTNFGYEARVG